MTVLLTRHALDRMKTRTDFSPTRAREIAEEVYYCGKTIKDFKNEKEKQKYLRNVLNASHEQGRGNTIRVMGNDIYIFCDTTLITVFPFPPKLTTNINIQKENFTKKSLIIDQTKICKI